MRKRLPAKKAKSTLATERVGELDEAGSGDLDEMLNLEKDELALRDDAYGRRQKEGEIFDEQTQGSAESGAKEDRPTDEAKDAKEAKQATKQGEAKASNSAQGAVAKASKQLEGGLEKALDKIHAQVVEKADVAHLNPVVPRAAGENAFSALHNAQPSGVFFRIVGEGGGQGMAGEAESPLDPKLLEAVEEARRILDGVPGVEPHRIKPGEDDEHAPVVLIPVVRGFTQSGMAKVPLQVRGFATLIAVPYELLPLKRDI